MSVIDVAAAATWILLPAIAAVVAHRRLRRSGSRALGRGSLATGLVGIATIGIALSPSVDAAADRAFAPHMVQHLAIGIVGPLLVVIGRLPELANWVVPPSALRSPTVRTVLRRPRSIAPPAIVLVLVWYSWHLPALYSAAADHAAVHAAEHLFFLGSGAWYWAAVAPQRRRTGAAVLASFSVTIALGFLGAVLSLSPVPFYEASVSASSESGLLDDQRLGGLLMWTPGGLVHLVAAVAQLTRWIGLDTGPPVVRAVSSR